MFSFRAQGPIRPSQPDPAYATAPLPALSGTQKLSGEEAKTDGTVWDKPCDAFSKHKKCEGKNDPPKNLPDPTKVTSLLETLRTQH